MYLVAQAVNTVNPGPEDDHSHLNGVADKRRREVTEAVELLEMAAVQEKLRFLGGKGGP